MAFPPGFLDELRNRVSLAELIGRQVRLIRRGREYVGLCPFHHEKTPSFCVVEDKGFFHCFGCGAHGDAIGYTMRADNVDFVEAIERLAGLAGLAVPQSTPQERERAQRQKTLLEALEAAAAFYEKRLWSPLGQRGLDYLLARGLDEETIRRFRLGWAPEDRQSLRRALVAEYPEPLLLEAGLIRASERGGDPYDYFGNRVIFPIGDRRGRVIAFGGRIIGEGQPKYLNSPDSPIFEKGRVLYGISIARGSTAPDADGNAQSAIVTEGYMDVITLHRAGFTTAVAPLGTALTEAHLEELWRLSPEPVLCLDSDKAGGVAAIRALNRALPLLQPGHGLRFVVLPAREDPDSLIRASGAAAFAERLGAARSLSQFWWDCELQAWPIDTPERRSDFERRLMDGTNLITNRTVQSAFKRFFRDRLFSLGRSGRSLVERTKARPTGQDSLRSAYITNETPPPLPRAPGRANREVFLGLLVRCPALIDERIEEITAIEVPEPDLDRLRRAILEAAHAHPGLDAAQLQQHLDLCGLANMVAILTRRITAHAGFAAGGGDDLEVIRLGLEETLRLLRAQVPGDLQAAERAFAADASDENWRRLNALIERDAHDGPIGGTGW